MQAITFLVILAGWISATLATPFVLTAAHVGEAIDQQPIQATGERLWIGKTTTTYCSDDLGIDCSAFTNFTTYSVDSGDLSMAVAVPGGQGVYIDATCGAVSYTQAHLDVLPAGAILGGWTYDQGLNNAPYGFLDWGNGLFACSVTGDSSEGPWEIYADLTGEEFGDECVAFDALAYDVAEDGAWEYT